MLQLKMLDIVGYISKVLETGLTNAAEAGSVRIYRRSKNVSYLSTNHTIVSCHSFRVLMKALFLPMELLKFPSRYILEKFLFQQ